MTMTNGARQANFPTWRDANWLLLAVEQHLVGAAAAAKAIRQWFAAQRHWRMASRQEKS